MKIDVVIKVGGSLGRWNGLGKLLDSIARWKGASKILVIPGGGVFADLVRAEYRRLRLSENAAHRMAILAMDQYGLELCDLASQAAPASSLNQVMEVIRSGRLPVYLPSRSLARHDPFTHSWGVTSDSIAAYVAGRVGAKALLLLKSVDGIFARDPKVDPSAALLARVARSRLPRDGCVDREFARWLNGIDCCWIINGTRPARVKKWLESGKTVGTCVITRGARRKKQD
ncbi:MAG TPA: uridylate kinase [Patescibacteria group bacterium]|nr:uridylate kinase [Patescibacteria group bacterium]